MPKVYLGLKGIIEPFKTYLLTLHRNEFYKATFQVAPLNYIAFNSVSKMINNHAC